MGNSLPIPGGDSGGGNVMMMVKMVTANTKVCLGVDGMYGLFSRI